MFHLNQKEIHQKVDCFFVSFLISFRIVFKRRYVYLFRLSSSFVEDIQLLLHFSTHIPVYIIHRKLKNAMKNFENEKYFCLDKFCQLKLLFNFKGAEIVCLMCFSGIFFYNNSAGLHFMKYFINDVSSLYYNGKLYIT